jgi:sec-independent protein translocase protein TatA
MTDGWAEAFPMNFLALLSNFGGPDLIIILLIVLVLFGAKKLPELARGMGQAVKEFQKAKDEFSDELHSAGTAPAPKAEDVRPPEASVPRIPDAPTARKVPPTPAVERPASEIPTSREV